MVYNAIKEKRRLWKEWTAGGSKEIYLEPIRQGLKFMLLRSRLRKRDPKIFEMMKGVGFLRLQSKWQEQIRSVGGEKCIRKDHGDLAFGHFVEEAWYNYYS